jgi:hypothetical protein
VVESRAGRRSDSEVDLRRCRSNDEECSKLGSKVKTDEEECSKSEIGSDD